MNIEEPVAAKEESSYDTIYNLKTRDHKGFSAVARSGDPTGFYRYRVFKREVPYNWSQDHNYHQAGSIGTFVTRLFDRELESWIYSAVRGQLKDSEISATDGRAPRIDSCVSQPKPKEVIDALAHTEGHSPNDDRSDSMNQNNDAYYTDRGEEGRPDDWEEDE